MLIQLLALSLLLATGAKADEMSDTVASCVAAFAAGDMETYNEKAKDGHLDFPVFWASF